MNSLRNIVANEQARRQKDIEEALATLRAFYSDYNVPTATLDAVEEHLRALRLIAPKG